MSQFHSNAQKQQNKKFLGELYDFPDGAMSVGRLDEKSEGLLLITTDGKVSDFINSGKIEKQYYALVDGDINLEAIERLKNGVEIGLNGKKYKTKPCHVRKLDEYPNLPERSKKIRDSRHGPVSWVSITLREGKFRQIRKMTSAVGCPTLRLVRVRVGEFELRNMVVGEVIPVETLI